MEQGAPRIFVVAGEPSGDVHASHLMREIAAAAPEVRFRGFGGGRMVREGLEQLEDLPAQAIMGLFPVIAALPRIRAWFRAALDDMKARRPDALLLVDYPGFNLRLAARAHAMGIPVIYYISPQVWAWNRRRVRHIAEVVDLMIVILPFEVDFYREHGVEVFYAGHPLVDHLAHHPPDRARVDRLRAAGGSPLIGIFPGSRRHVVESLAPVFARASRRLRDEHGLGDARFVVAAATPDIARLIEERGWWSTLPHELVVEQPLEVMSAADLCLTTSGTTTLEIAAHLKPMILAYRVSPVLWTIGRLVVRVPHIGLVNLIAGRGLVPEHVGVRAFDAALARDLADLARNEARREAMVQGLREVRRKLETPGSYERCARRVVDFLREGAGSTGSAGASTGGAARESQ